MDYQEFLKTKVFTLKDEGFSVEENNLNPFLFDFQKAIISWALKKGRCAIFADCGLGKTLMQLEFSSHVVKKTNGKTLILAPLAVSHQTVREGVKFGIDVNLCK